MRNNRPGQNWNLLAALLKISSQELAIVPSLPMKINGMNMDS